VLNGAVPSTLREISVRLTKAASRNKFPEFRLSWNRSSWSDGVIPCWADGMVLDVERCHVGVGDSLASRIIAWIEDRLHNQARRGVRAANESQDGVPSS
jgi:hypothetical protein